MKTLLAYISIMILPLMCGGNDNTVYEATESVEYADTTVEAVKFIRPVVANSEEIGEETVQKIIREADVRFETQDLNTSYTRIAESLKKYNGYVQNETEGKDYNSLYKNIIVRLPNTHFDRFMADLSTGVSFFDRKQISARDVTEEFIDIEARLKAQKTLEERYLQLLNKATKVSEILEIERELSSIRQEIEVKEGRLKYLQNKVSLSTVSIEMYKRVANAENATVSYGSKMWNAVKSGWNGISSFFIGLLYIWPFILILVAVFFFVRRKLRKKA